MSTIANDQLLARWLNMNEVSERDRAGFIAYLDARNISTPNWFELDQHWSDYFVETYGTHRS